MTDSDAAVRFDALLDQLMRGDAPPDDALGATARTVQHLHLTQRATPSEAFRARLRANLTEEVPVSTANGHHPEAVFTAPVRLPERPVARPASHRWLAIAAVLALLIGGMGAFVAGPWGRSAPPEPSAIPAAMAGTVEPSPAAALAEWAVAPPQGSSRLFKTGMVANGRVFTLFALDEGQITVQTVDVQSGAVLWSGPLGNEQRLLVVPAGDLLLATGSNEQQHALTAYDGSSGEVRWQIELPQRPVGLLADDDRIVVLGSGNGLDAFDLRTQASLWHADLSEYDQAAADDAGMNTYFNMMGSRLAETDGMVGAIVSNGRLVGVDAADGSVRWANERTTESATTVLAVDGLFAVSAPGSDMQGYDYDGAAGTPMPETDRCQAALAPRDGATPGAISPNGAGVDSFDPRTGASPWGVVSNRPAAIWQLDDANLVAVVSPGWDIVNDRPQDLVPCKIDGATGAVSDLDGNSLAAVVLDDSTDALVGMVGFPGGGSILVSDLDPTVADALPHVDASLFDSYGVAWVQTVDQMTLVVIRDGTLLGLPENGLDEQSGDAVATPVTFEPGDVIWSTPGKEGIGTEWHEPVFADGRIFRSFRNLVTEDTIQAVDTESGATLWEKALNIGTTSMMTEGDLLIVAGRDKSVMGPSALVLALDPATGDEVWRASSKHSPVAMEVADDRILLLGADNTLDAFDLQTGEARYSKDLTGDSRPSGQMPSLPEGMAQMQMSIVGDTVVAVLADTSLVGVDSTTGVARWWRLREDRGSVWLYGVGEKLVVLDLGDLEGIFEYESSFSSTSPEATPIVTWELGHAQCLDAGATPTPREIDVEAPLPPEQQLIGLDPSTGETRWTADTGYQNGPLVEGNEELFYLTTIREAWPIVSAKSTVCAIDPESGSVFEVDSLAPFADMSFVAAFASNPDMLFQADVIDGELLLRLDGLDRSTTQPAIVLDDMPNGILRWIEVYDRYLYIATEDQELVKVQLPTDQ